MKIKNVFEIWDDVVAQVEGSESSDQSTKTTQIAQDFFHQTGVNPQAVVPLEKIKQFAQGVQWYTVRNIESVPSYLKAQDNTQKVIKDLQWSSKTTPLLLSIKKSYITQPSKAAWKFTFGWFVFCLSLCIAWTWWWTIPFLSGLVINWFFNPYFHIVNDYGDHLSCKTNKEWEDLKKILDNNYTKPVRDSFEQVQVKADLLPQVIESITDKSKGLTWLTHNTPENKNILSKIIQGGFSPSMMIHAESFILNNYWNKEGTPFTSETLLPICYVERDGYAIVFSGLDGRPQKTQADIRKEELQGVDHEARSFDELASEDIQNQWELFKTIYKGVLDNLSHKDIDENVCRGIYQKLRRTSENFQSNMQNMQDNFQLMMSLPEKGSEKVATKVLELGSRSKAKDLGPKEILKEVNKELHENNEKVVQGLFSVVASLSILKNTGEDSHKILSCFSKL